MAEPLSLGVDVGTAFIKAAIVGQGPEPLASVRRPTPWSATPAGVVADPIELQAAVLATITDAVAAAGLSASGPGSIAAVGVVSMGESGVGVDSTGRPVWPAIAWHEPVGLELEADLRALSPNFAALTGRAPRALCSIVKWRHLTHAIGAAHRWFSMAEFAVAGLGVVPASEGSLLSRTGALAVESGELLPVVLAWAGVPGDFVTPPVPAGSSAGPVTSGPSAIRGAAISASGLDCYAAAFAADVTRPDEVFLSCGTSGAAIRVLPAGFPVDFEAAAELGLTVDRWLDGQRLVLLGASPCGLVLDPLRAQIGPPGSAVTAESWRAAFCAVAEGQRRMLAALIAIGGPVNRYVGTGGWLRFDGLAEAITDRVRPIEIRAGRELGAVGAARIAAVGTRSLDRVRR